MKPKDLRKYCILDEISINLLKQAIDKLGFTYLKSFATHDGTLHCKNSLLKKYVNSLLLRIIMQQTI